MNAPAVIHPNQIAAANATYSPSAAELERCGRIIAAHAKALGRGDGVAVLDGRLAENLHVTDAKRPLSAAAAIRVLKSSTWM